MPLVAAVILVVVAAVPAVAQSTARTVRIPSEGLGLRAFSVLLPTDYESTDRRYPVLYLLHGGGQDHTAFMARKDFAKRARTVAMIVVMPAADRGGVQAEVATRYEDFLARDLVTYVDANYRTVASPQTRAIAGLSMGGMFATGTAFRHPEVFGVVGAFSPAAPRTAAPSPTGSSASPYFYVSCGTADSLLPVSRQIVDRLKQQGWPHEYHEVPGFGHSWDFWDPQIDAFFSWLYVSRGWPRAS